MALGPIAVLPAWQRRGVGSALMRAALAKAEAAGLSAVVLLGHKEYYPRFGFQPARAQGLHPPAAWPDALTHHAADTQAESLSARFARGTHRVRGAAL
jgi:predicted N-acetyltransferase YhbS